MDVLVWVQWSGQEDQIDSFQQLNYEMKQEGEWEPRPRLEPCGISTCKEQPTEEYI